MFIRIKRGRHPQNDTNDSPTQEQSTEGKFEPSAESMGTVRMQQQLVLEQQHHLVRQQQQQGSMQMDVAQALPPGATALQSFSAAVDLLAAGAPPASALQAQHGSELPVLSAQQILAVAAALERPQLQAEGQLQLPLQQPLASLIDQELLSGLSRQLSNADLLTLMLLLEGSEARAQQAQQGDGMAVVESARAQQLLAQQLPPETQLFQLLEQLQPLASSMLAPPTLPAVPIPQADVRLPSPSGRSMASVPGDASLLPEQALLAELARVLSLALHPGSSSCDTVPAGQPPVPADVSCGPGQVHMHSI